MSYFGNAPSGDSRTVRGSFSDRKCTWFQRNLLYACAFQRAKMRGIPRTSKVTGKRIYVTHPPCSQTNHGSVLPFVVSDPFSFSKAQKNRVSLSCPARFTGMLPAKLRVSGNVTLGRLSLTWKSSRLSLSHSVYIRDTGRLSLTALPLCAETSTRLSRVDVREGTIWRLSEHAHGQRGGEDSQGRYHDGGSFNRSPHLDCSL